MIFTISEHAKQSDSTVKSTSNAETHTPEKRKKSLSMHDDVPVWYDCCSCEAEPYWTESEEQRTTE